MILATNSPNIELVITILIDLRWFVNKKNQKFSLFLFIFLCYNMREGVVISVALLKDVRGVGPKSLTLLNNIGINTIDDLVTHYPFRYELL